MNTIGLDIGTSSVKALLVASSGEVLKVCSPEYPFQTPKPLWAETDPNVWWEATQKRSKHFWMALIQARLVGSG